MLLWGRYNSDGKIEQQIGVREDELSNAITTVRKDSFVYRRHGGDTLEDPNINFMTNEVKNIVKTERGYVLEKAYELDENGRLRETGISKNNPNCNSVTKNCYRCIYNSDKCCLLRSELENMPENIFVLNTSINKCDAYNPVFPLNIIKSEKDMIEFVVKAKNFFGCPEDYESYFGFERNWNEETGDILETTREYYERGGKFEFIPDKYPCVIYFSVMDLDVLRGQDEKLSWIYIGD